MKSGTEWLRSGFEEEAFFMQNSRAINKRGKLHQYHGAYTNNKK